MMFFKTRSKLLFYYRMIFVILFLLLGVSGTGIIVLEHYAGIELIEIESAADKQAMFATSSVMGALGFFTAFIMLYLMREKRKRPGDRREISKPLDFVDRRLNADRRTIY